MCDSLIKYQKRLHRTRGARVPLHRRGNDARAALEVPCRTADAPEESITQPGSGENLRLSARVAHSLALVLSTRGACTTVDPMCLTFLRFINIVESIS